MSASFTTGQRQTLFDVVLLVRYLPASRILKYQSVVTAGQVPVLSGGKNSPLSAAYIRKPRPTWRLLLAQAMALALSLALLSAGRSIAAKIAMMAITTSSSISVKPLLFGGSGKFMLCQASQAASVGHSVPCESSFAVAAVEPWPTY